MNLFPLKKEQKVCLQPVAKKQDALPTGFGKSLIFQLLPWVLKEMWNLEHSMVVTVTRLVSFLKDKVVKLSNSGLKAFAIDAGEKEGFWKVLHVPHQSAIVPLRFFWSLLPTEELQAIPWFLKS